jgi:hypothetical protein
MILPDWHLPNLASRILSLCQKRPSADWQTVFCTALTSKVRILSTPDKLEDIETRTCALERKKRSLCPLRLLRNPFSRFIAPLLNVTKKVGQIFSFIMLFV